MVLDKTRLGELQKEGIHRQVYNSRAVLESRDFTKKGRGNNVCWLPFAGDFAVITLNGALHIA